MHKSNHIIVKIAFGLFISLVPTFTLHASDDDDFASIFEGLFSGEDNPFLEMFGQSDEAKEKKNSSKKKEEPIKVVEMPTKERLALFEELIQSILTPLGSLIQNMHFNHIILGGSVYERIQHHRAPMMGVESTLLHVLTLQKYLPAKEIEPFIKILEKESAQITSLLNELLTQAYKPVAHDVDAENAFILGKSDKSPVFIPTSHRKKLEGKFAALSNKLKPFNAALKKTLESPDIKKLFPEQKATPTKTYAPTSSSGKYSPSSPSRPQQSTSRGKSSSYGDDYYDPYSSHYSSNFPYDEYEQEHETDKPEEPKKDALAPAPSAQQPEHKANLIELVNQLTENETVNLLRDVSNAGPMLTDPTYFSTMANAFETLFKHSADGGLGTIAQLLKTIEKEKESVEKALEKAKPDGKTLTVEAKKVTHRSPTTPLSEKETQEQEAEIAQNAALETYKNIKLNLVQALTRLYFTPAQQWVTDKPLSKTIPLPRPITVFMLPEHEHSGHRLAEIENKQLSRNALDQEDEFCSASQKKIHQFVNLLNKKLDMKSITQAYEQKLMAEVLELETIRSEKIKNLAASLNTTPLTLEEAPHIEATLQTLTEQAEYIRRTAPTLKTCETHFYKLSLAQKYAQEKKAPPKEEEKVLKEGQGTTRWDVTQALEGLKSKLQTYKQAAGSGQEEIPEEIKSIERSMLKTSSAWTASLVLKAEISHENRPAQPRLSPAEIAARTTLATQAASPKPAEEENASSPGFLRRLMSKITG